MATIPNTKTHPLALKKKSSETPFKDSSLKSLLDKKTLEELVLIIKDAAVVRQIHRRGVEKDVICICNMCYARWWSVRYLDFVDSAMGASSYPPGGSPGGYFRSGLRSLKACFPTIRSLLI
jgi:hypothetical protein